MVCTGRERLLPIQSQARQEPRSPIRTLGQVDFSLPHALPLGAGKNRQLKPLTEAVNSNFDRR